MLVTMKRHLIKSQTGFTLVELMITVAIAAILLGIGIPSFQELLSNGRVSSTTNDFVSSLQITRSEAVKRGHQVTMCKSSDGATCANSGSWEDGWIVITDEDNNQTLSLGESIIQVHEPVSNGTLTSSNHFISFTADGATAHPGTVSLSLAGKTKNIVLAGVGRIKTN